MILLTRMLATLLLVVLCGCSAQSSTTATAPLPGSGQPSSGVASPLPSRSPEAPQVAGEVTVFAASSLTDAFGEIGERFKAANPNASVNFNFGASSQLFTQIDQGAPADVFASADQIQMDRARTAGRIEGVDAPFARNRLVIITPANNPAGITSPADLAKPGVKLVTSQPDVPIGVYTQNMLDKMSQDPQLGADFRDKANGNILSQEANVRQIVSKVQLGEADAGVVYKSDVTPQSAPQLATIDIPDVFNTIATYPIATVQNAPDLTAGTAFIAFVLSPAGQEILGKWNFVPAVQ